MSRIIDARSDTFRGNRSTQDRGDGLFPEQRRAFSPGRSTNASRSYHPRNPVPGGLRAGGSLREKSGGKNIQTLGSACAEMRMVRSSFCDFRIQWINCRSSSFTGRNGAPRRLQIDNNIDWLGPNVHGLPASHGSGVATSELYTQVGGHDHCSLPEFPVSLVQSYVKKYLLDLNRRACEKSRRRALTSKRSGSPGRPAILA